MYYRESYTRFSNRKRRRDFPRWTRRRENRPCSRDRNNSRTARSRGSYNPFLPPTSSCIDMFLQRWMVSKRQPRKFIMANPKRGPRGTGRRNSWLSTLRRAITDNCVVSLTRLRWIRYQSLGTTRSSQTSALPVTFANEQSVFLLLLRTTRNLRTTGNSPLGMRSPDFSYLHKSPFPSVVPSFSLLSYEE